MAKIGRNQPCPCGSGKKFKRCHDGNWPPAEGYAEVQQYEATSPLSLPELAHGLHVMLAKQRAHPMSVVTTALKRVREVIRLDESSTEYGLHVASAGAAILAACYCDGIPDYTDPKIPLAEGPFADHFLLSVRNRLDRVSGSARNEPLLALLQLLCTQGALQGNHAFQFFRTLYLLELTGFEGDMPRSPYDELFQGTYGCSAAEYLAVLAAFWCVSALGGERREYFVDDTVARNSPIADRLRPIAARILQEHGCRIQGVKGVVDGFGNHGVDGLVAAFFAKYPFIEFRPGTYFPAPHPYIRVLTITAPIFRTLELGRKRAGHADCAETQRMGMCFEQLVHALFVDHFPAEQLEAEHAAARKASRRSPDVFLFEGQGATIIQAKLKRLSPGAFFGLSTDAIRKDAHKAMAETVSKSIRYLAWLDTPEADRDLTDHGRRVRDRLRATERLFLLGVVSAMPSVFHVGVFRDMVEAGIRDRLDDRERAWLTANRGRIRGWHIIDSEELAAFLRWRGSLGLLEALSEYLAHPQFGMFIKHGKVLAPFSTYVVARGRRRGLRPIDLNRVNDAVRGFSDWLLRFIFGETPDRWRLVNPSLPVG